MALKEHIMIYTVKTSHHIYIVSYLIRVYSPPMFTLATDKIVSIHSKCNDASSNSSSLYEKNLPNSLSCTKL